MGVCPLDGLIKTLDQRFTCIPPALCIQGKANNAAVCQVKANTDVFAIGSTCAAPRCDLEIRMKSVKAFHSGRLLLRVALENATQSLSINHKLNRVAIGFGCALMRSRSFWLSFVEIGVQPETVISSRSIASQGSNQRINVHSGGLFDWAVCATQVSPIDIGAQVFAADGAVGFAFNFNCELFAARLAVTNVFDVAARRCTAHSKGVALVYRHREKIRSKFHALKYTPSGVVRKHQFVNIAK